MIFEGKREHTGHNTGFFIEFATDEGQQVLLKAGLSYVSLEGAQANLKHDIPAWDFDAVHQASRKRWSDITNLVDVEGGSEEDKTIFYTALYHTHIDPRSVSDVDGWFTGADNKKHRADGYVYRTVFSGWDVYRSQFPLLTILRPDVVNDQINSMLHMAKTSGKNYLPKWELLNTYTPIMPGNSGLIVVADAYEKGIRNYDVEEAYRVCINSAEEKPSGDELYKMSENLERGYAEWCMGRFAESRGKGADAQKYYQKSMVYKKFWDPKAKWMRALPHTDKPFDKLKHHQGTVESNPYQQGWFVPHDIPGLQDLMGKKFFAQELERFFDETPDNLQWNDYYNHPNEPVHHVPFLFNYIGKPWLTQKWTRKICDTPYGVGVEGLCGNDDVGQMSAWYILCAMGIHPVCPGDNTYQITSPIFSKVTVRLDPDYYEGKIFTVSAKNNSRKNIYIQSSKLNGMPLNRTWITHQEIVSGGTLELVMGPEIGLGLRAQD